MKTKMNGLFAGIVGTGLLMASFAANALSFNVYTDRAAWEAAVGSFTVEGFETAEPFSFDIGKDPSTASLADFDLKVDANPNFIQIGPAGALSGKHGFLGLVGGEGTATTYPVLANSFIFNEGITAFGFDIGLFGTGAGIFAKIADEAFAINVDWESTDNLFFGVVADGSFSRIDLVHQEYYGEEGFLLDDVSYSRSAAPAEVPEPASAAILMAGVVGMAAARRRKSA